MNLKFKKGERVRVVTTRWDTVSGGIQFGVCGLVTEVWRYRTTTIKSCQSQIWI